MAKRKIRRISIGASVLNTDVFVHRGSHDAENSICRLYNPVTPSSLRRAQRAQLALMEKGGKE